MTSFWTLVTLGELCRTCFLWVQISKAPWHFWSGFFSLELLGGFSLDLSCDFPFAMPSACAGVELNLPSRMFCCCFTVSLCLTKFVAFSRVRFGSSWSFPEILGFCNPTTIWCEWAVLFNAPKFQYLARPYKSVIILSIDSPVCWLFELNFALSKMTFSFYDEVILELFCPSFLQNSSPVRRRWIRMRWIYRRLVHPLCEN